MLFLVQNPCSDPTQSVAMVREFWRANKEAYSGYAFFESIFRFLNILVCIIENFVLSFLILLYTKKFRKFCYKKKSANTISNQNKNTGKSVSF